MPTTITAALWNQRHPVGTPVRYYPIMGEPEHVDTVTRSEAWELGHGQPVVKISGRTGGVCLQHIEVLAAAPAPATT